MANLKIDLVNNLNNEKYYGELEVIRLAQDPNINYKTKLDEISFELGKIAMVNAKLGIAQQFFQDEQPPQKQPVIAPPPVQQKSNGQTHSE